MYGAGNSLEPTIVFLKGGGLAKHRLWIALSLLGSTSVATAGPAAIYVDGRPMTERRATRFNNVDVEIQRDGTIRIHTRKGAPTAPEPPSSSMAEPLRDVTAPLSNATAPLAVDARPLEERYWMTTQAPSTAPADWEVELILNGRPVGVFGARDPRVIEVTSMLLRGENTAQVAFRRTGTASVTPAPSAQDVFQVLLAPGQVDLDQDQIQLAYPIFSLRRIESQEQGPPEVLKFVLPVPARP